MKQSLKEWYEFLSAVVILLTLAAFLYGFPILVFTAIIVFTLRLMGVHL